MRKCAKIEAVNAVVTLVSSLRMRSFSRTGFLTTCVCAGQINTQQLLASGASVRARVHSFSHLNNNTFDIRPIRTNSIDIIQIK